MYVEGCTVVAVKRFSTLACTVLLLGAGACSQSHQSQALPHTRSTLLPTEAPCVYPSPADLVALEAQSTSVVEAELGSAAKASPMTVGGTPVSRYSTPLSSVKILGHRGPKTLAPAPPTAIDGLGFSWSTTQPPGHYLVFLDGQIPVNGMYGIFRIENGKLVRHCPNYGDAAHPLVASGTGPTLASVEAAIPSVLPTLSVPAKPSWALEGPLPSSSTS